MMEDINGKRNFNTISPSAKSLMFLKGFTNIPFARRTAELLMAPKEYNPDFNRKEMTFWARVVHFESRYWSIGQLLEDIKIRNILELSSGFSFRGLDMVSKGDYHYIDTDLPDVIEIKKDFNKALQDETCGLKGTLELLALNCLDEIQFQEVTDHFQEGEIVIVNEGMLMYLDMAEKEKLCGIIYKILKERGGCWITTDIYRKNPSKNSGLKVDERTKEFFLQHKIEENKFESFGEAELFFNRLGFEIDRTANVSRSKLSSLKYFMKNVSFWQLIKIRRSGKLQATWRLKLASKPTWEFIDFK
jgi:O-methyltransferase involved in polyketide biosynthesis